MPHVRRGRRSENDKPDHRAPYGWPVAIAEGGWVAKKHVPKSEQRKDEHRSANQTPEEFRHPSAQDTGHCNTQTEAAKSIGGDRILCPGCNQDHHHTKQGGENGQNNPHAQTDRTIARCPRLFEPPTVPGHLRNPRFLLRESLRTSTGKVQIGPDLLQCAVADHSAVFERTKPLKGIICDLLNPFRINPLAEILHADYVTALLVAANAKPGAWKGWRSIILSTAWKLKQSFAIEMQHAAVGQLDKKMCVMTIHTKHQQNPACFIVGFLQQAIPVEFCQLLLIAPLRRSGVNPKQDEDESRS
ncbi:MAG: hypothetical protein SGI99_05425, partial [Pseudomonadota bacterium]|nr:hypothetical protein [Pseudomonadota bacterium]